MLVMYNNGRSNLVVLPGMMNPYRLLGYLRFCKLCKNQERVRFYKRWPCSTIFETDLTIRV